MGARSHPSSDPYSSIAVGSVRANSECTADLYLTAHLATENTHIGKASPLTNLIPRDTALPRKARQEQGSPFRFSVESRWSAETEFRSGISVNFGEFRRISVDFGRNLLNFEFWNEIYRKIPKFRIPVTSENEKKKPKFRRNFAEKLNPVVDWSALALALWVRNWLCGGYLPVKFR